MLQPGENWYGIRDGDWRARAFLDRHYSARRYKDGRRSDRIIGPGEYMLLLTADSQAIFNWVYKNAALRLDKQEGVYCSIFRNEGPVLSSALIKEADALAWGRWDHRRHYTYVNPDKVASRNPGYCFIMAGWHRDGWSKSGLIRLAIEREVKQ